jgi:GTP pyrophosphokinase
MGRNAIPFEVQIRTWEMHQIAEYGVAAHWKYKSGEESKEEIDRKLSWIAKLIETEDDTRDPEEFLQALKIDIMHDETFVFTPKGDIITLPQGATVIDFAYAIHSEVGNKMVGAKINGMIAPIDRVPQTGDIIEIITSASSKGPSRDWLGIVKTSEASSKSGQWFKKEKRPENIKLGIAELERELSRFKVKPTEAQKEEIIQGTAKKLGMKDADDLCNAVGYSGIAMTKVQAKLKSEYERVVKPDEQPVITDTSQVQVKKDKKVRKSGGVIVDGEYGCDVKFAKCCNPLPGDDIIGFVTKGYGISIHKRDCPNAIEGMKNPEMSGRWKYAEWDSDDYIPGEGKPLYEVMLQIYAENNIMLLADITGQLAEMKVSLLSINTKKRTENEMLINLTVGCRNIEHYEMILAKLKRIRHVISVTRGFA